MIEALEYAEQQLSRREKEKELKTTCWFLCVSNNWRQALFVVLISMLRQRDNG